MAHRGAEASIRNRSQQPMPAMTPCVVPGHDSLLKTDRKDVYECPRPESNQRTRFRKSVERGAPSSLGFRESVLYVRTGLASIRNSQQYGWVHGLLVDGR